jgi:GDP-L-fucose synthase
MTTTIWRSSAYSLENKKIWIAGHKGLVGRAFSNRLAQENCTLLTTDFDLRHQADTLRWFHQNKPDIVIIAAARVGGILVNFQKPAEFLYDNLMIESNIINSAHLIGVEKLLFLGSSCIYPKEAPQPITEDSLLTAPLEPTNEAYAIAKIAGIKLCQSYREQYGANFISAMPCNLYGPGDCFDAASSHVIPALIMKAHEAKMQGHPSLKIWGSGTSLREFLYIDDLADALLFLLQNYEGKQHINIGSGQELSILELTKKICAVIGFDGTIELDTSMPDGTMRKIMDSSKIQQAGWQFKTDLETGLQNTYKWFCDTYDKPFDA